MPMVGGFSFLAHDWDDLNPGIYAKGHFYQKAALAGYVSDVKQGRKPAYNRFHIYTVPVHFISLVGFKKSDIKARNPAFTHVVTDKVYCL